MVRIRWVLLALIMVLLLGCSQSSLKIGVLVPLDTEMGQSQLNAIEMALGNYDNVELIVKNSGLNGADALKGAQELISIERVDAIIGPSIGSAVKAIKPLAEDTETIFITPAAENPRIVDGEFMFRTAVSFEFDIDAFLQEIIVMNYSRILIIESENHWIKGTAEVFAKKLDSTNVKYFIRTVNSNATDLKSSLFMVKDPDAIFLLVYPKEGELLLDHIEDMKVNSKIYALRTMLSQEMIMKDFVFSSVQSDTEQWFVEEYKEKYGLLPDSTADAAYDALRLIVEGFKNGGVACEEYIGACGNVKFNERGDLVKQVVLVK